MVVGDHPSTYVDCQSLIFYQICLADVVRLDGVEFIARLHTADLPQKAEVIVGFKIKRRRAGCDAGRAGADHPSLDVVVDDVVDFVGVGGDAIDVDCGHRDGGGRGDGGGRRCRNHSGEIKRFCSERSGSIFPLSASASVARYSSRMALSFFPIV
jgi:hypothetical protein